MEHTRRQVDTRAVASGAQLALVEDLTVLGEQQQAEAPLEYDQRLGLAGIQVPVRRDVGVRLEPYGHAMAGLFHMMEVMVLAAARRIARGDSQLGEQLLVEVARAAHLRAP
ncbi:Uncharacterised protein [Pseudomonas aeruginosa]|nr:Uncharacterised protein [Pseudomonas aeruginosa]